jgi:hypothetical protein
MGRGHNESAARRTAGEFIPGKYKLNGFIGASIHKMPHAMDIKLSIAGGILWVSALIPAFGFV